MYHNRVPISSNNYNYNSNSSGHMSLSSSNNVLLCLICLSCPCSKSISCLNFHLAKPCTNKHSHRNHQLNHPLSSLRSQSKGKCPTSTTTMEPPWWMPCWCIIRNQLLERSTKFVKVSHQEATTTMPTPSLYLKAWHDTHLLSGMERRRRPGRRLLHMSGHMEGATSRQHNTTFAWSGMRHLKKNSVNRRQHHGSQVVAQKAWQGRMSFYWI